VIDQAKLYYCHGDGEPPDHWFDVAQVSECVFDHMTHAVYNVPLGMGGKSC